MDVIESTAAADETQPVENDLACASCGYNLRGLTLGMRCPECGAEVSRSARGDLLRFADPDWVGKLASGTSLMRWGIVASMLLGLVGSLAVGGLAVAGGYSQRSLFLLVGMVTLIGQVMLLWAAFLITTQEPRVSLQEGTVTARRVVRYCAVLSFVGQFLQLAAPVTAKAVFMALLTLGGMGLTLAGIVGFFAQFVFFRRFALRVPDARLADSTRTVMWGFVISYAVVVIAGLIAAISGIAAAGASPAGAGTRSVRVGLAGTGGAAGAGATAGLIGGGLLVCAGAVAAAVFTCWAYRLLLKYNKVFKLAAQEARSVEARPAISQ